jgi:hypothetical protein
LIGRGVRICRVPDPLRISEADPSGAFCISESLGITGCRRAPGTAGLVALRKARVLSRAADMDNVHPGEDVLDEYAMKRLPDAVAACVEEHLLVCAACCDALQRIDSIRSVLVQDKLIRPHLTPSIEACRS